MKLQKLMSSFRMAGRLTGEELPLFHAELAIVGKALDDRGRAALEFTKKTADTLEICEYDVATQQVTLGESTVSPFLIHKEIERRGAKKIVLECTTLGTAEIALCCRAMARLDGVVLSFLYLEPKTYRPDPQDGVIHRRDFELSVSFKGFRSLPGMAYQMDDNVRQTTVLLLGFEGNRAQQMFEETKVSPGCIAVVFGVPAFQPGWEYDAFANNLGSLQNRDLGRGVHFCGADNPKAILQYLVSLKANYPTEDTLFVAPLGPKPQALGAVLFSAFSERVGLLYDFPVRKASRSSDVAKWHLFQTEW